MEKKHYILSNELSRDTFLAQVITEIDGFVKSARLMLYNNQLGKLDMTDEIDAEKDLGKKNIDINFFISQIMSENDSINVTEIFEKNKIDAEDLLLKLGSEDEIISTMAYQVLNEIGVK